MIKCDGFGKLLKLSFFTLLTSCFGLLGSGFVSAGNTQAVGLDSNPSVYNDNYKLTFLKGGGLLTNYLGTSKGIMALDTNVLFWWAPNGQPYFYHPNFQGFFGEYYSCDELTLNNPTPVNCSAVPLTGDYHTIFKGFFSNVLAGDYVYYDYGYQHISSPNGYTYYQSIDVCFSSHSIGNSLCFRYGSFYQSQGYAPESYGSLVNSQEYTDLSFSNIPYSSIGYAPGQQGYNNQYDGTSDGKVNGSIDSSINGDYVYGDCTYNDVIIALESEGFNNYVCFGGIDNFSLYDSSVNYNPIPGTGLSISQIWGHSSASAWDNFIDWFIFWNGLYKDDSNNYNAMWESYPAVYHTYFQLYNTYAGGVLDPHTLLEYCQLKSATFDKNLSVGGYFKPACETIIREKQTGLWDSRINGTLYSGGVYTGDVPISVNWNGVGNMSGLNNYSDGTTFLQDFFNKARSVVPTNYSGDLFGGGFLPKYIIMFLCAILLFRFLMH